MTTILAGGDEAKSRNVMEAMEEMTALIHAVTNDDADAVSAAAKVQNKTNAVCITLLLFPLPPARWARLRELRAGAASVSVGGPSQVPMYRLSRDSRNGRCWVRPRTTQPRD
jgi:hypothetical protein